MRGLRTQESKNFEKFFEIIQKKATEKNSVFFLDSGEGDDFSFKGMECESLSGWLVPEEKVDDFEKVWMKKEEDDDWIDFFCFVECKKGSEGIDISFDFS